MEGRPVEVGGGVQKEDHHPLLAQSGSASALGAEGRRFESYQPDHILEAVVSLHVFGFLPFSEHWIQQPLICG